MKRVALLLAVALASVAVFAQKINKSELKQLQVFLSEPAEKDATNAQALKITDTVILPPGRALLSKGAI